MLSLVHMNIFQFTKCLLATFATKNLACSALRHGIQVCVGGKCGNKMSALLYILVLWINFRESIHTAKSAKFNAPQKFLCVWYTYTQ